MKCDTCAVQRRVNESKEPACCGWFLENVVCGDKEVRDCTAYEKDNKHE